MRGERKRLIYNHQAYLHFPIVYRLELWLESIEEALGSKVKYILPPEATEGAVELYLMLEQMKPPKKEQKGEGK